MEPLGDLTEEEALAYFREPVEAGVSAGADCILIETMGALDEALCAVTAAKTYGGGLPVLCTMTYDPNGHIMTGETVETVVAALEEAGVDALGCNCGQGPDQLVALLPRFTAAQPSRADAAQRGLPVYQDGETVYLVGPKPSRADASAFGRRRLGRSADDAAQPEHIACRRTRQSASNLCVPSLLGEILCKMSLQSKIFCRC